MKDSKTRMLDERPVTTQMTSINQHFIQLQKEYFALEVQYMDLLRIGIQPAAIKMALSIDLGELIMSVIELQQRPRAYSANTNTESSKILREKIIGLKERMATLATDSVRDQLLLSVSRQKQGINCITIQLE